MAVPHLPTIRHRIAWSYANLARAHVALEAGRTRYTKIDHMVRARLFKGLTTGSMAMRSFYDDEREKMIAPPCCAYCGDAGDLSLDHLIPRHRDGPDAAQNFVHACRGCNSSKGARDLLRWMADRGAFPSVFVLRRYLKLAAAECDRRQLLEAVPDGAEAAALPFQIQLLPVRFPPLAELDLHVRPRRPEA